MTKEEGELYITLATLHGPSTVNDISKGRGAGRSGARGSHEPLHHSPSGWWVFRDDVCVQSFTTREEAARHYCLHYGLIKP